jgi:NADH-quinone oxidoreductase subunit I
MTKVVEPKIGFWENLYVPEIARGVGVTVRHFVRNFFGKKDTVTINYPEAPITYAPRFRGQHRLTLRENNQVRCVACMCCSTACPANCIRIVASETDDARVEKSPVVFEIDQLRCVFCGMCVEACPCDAIRMDTGTHVKPVYDRAGAVHTKDLLMSFKGIDGTKTSSAVQGGSNRGGLAQDMLKKIETDLAPLDPVYEPRPAEEPKKAAPDHDHGHHKHGH